MNYGEAKFILSIFLNNQFLIISSTRSVGCVYKCTKKENTRFACLCKKLGKTRTVTVNNDRIISIKHPDDGHHPDCRWWTSSRLPVMDTERAWASLKQPPPVTDSGMYDTMKAFALYFERTWITGSYPVSLWTHFDNCGPRTTNIAEGRDKSLNHRFAVPHPFMRNFANWLHKCQYEIQCQCSLMQDVQESHALLSTNC